MPGSLTGLAIKSFGRLDGLVINHGLLVSERMANGSIETFKNLYDVNVFSALAMVRDPARLNLPHSLTNVFPGPKCAASAAQNEWLHRLGFIGSCAQRIRRVERLRIVQGSLELPLHSPRS